MELQEWSYKSCKAEFGVSNEPGNKWATLYFIESKEPNQGHATHLLIEAKRYYEAKGLVFGGSVALSAPMKHLYQKLEILEHEN